MELKHNDRVLFDSAAHLYLLDGKKLLMGVTELMQKHHLGADYAGISQEVLDKAAEEGTAIHRELQNYENGETMLLTPLIKDYKKLCQENGLKFVESEYPVSDYELVASAIDMVYEAKNGAVLVDIKTTVKLHTRALAWQLGIYDFLFRQQNPDIPVVGHYCLWIDKKTRKIKGLVPIEPVSEAEVLALLDAERKGEIYIDQHEEPSLDLVLGENAVAYAEGLGKLALLKAQIKEIEDGLKSYDAEIISFMEERGLTSIDTPEGKIIKRSASTSEVVDTDKLKTKYTNIWELVKKTKYTKASLTFKAK